MSERYHWIDLARAALPFDLARKVRSRTTAKYRRCLGTLWKEKPAPGWNSRRASEISSQSPALSRAAQVCPLRRIEVALCACAHLMVIPSAPGYPNKIRFGVMHLTPVTTTYSLLSVSIAGPLDRVVCSSIASSNRRWRLTRWPAKLIVGGGQPRTLRYKI
jgi:hypothetical protein